MRWIRCKDESLLAEAIDLIYVVLHSHSVLLRPYISTVESIPDSPDDDVAHPKMKDLVLFGLCCRVDDGMTTDRWSTHLRCRSPPSSRRGI